ncbi:uncharacterized protein LOC134235876 [Saccostrea cucullata]|uniref:uncharacterized protein LOC134235876 n=1 Tax=Saccostrea cuccullata TaxID=36930 RepID=UPI002ED2E271
MPEKSKETNIGTDNDGYLTIGEARHRNQNYSPNEREKSVESETFPKSTDNSGFFTKKKHVLGVVVALVIIIIVVVVVTLVTMGQDGNGNLKSSTENQKAVCPNVPTTNMKYSTEGKTGIQGRQFLVCFTDNHPEARNQTETIYILSEEDFEYKLISEFLDSSQLFKEVQTQSRNFKEINVTNTIALYDFEIEQKALLIETTRDVTVIIIDNYIHSSDSTSILPIKSISNSYVISTPGPFNKTLSGSSHFAIASQANRTIVKIRFHFDPDTPKIIKGITYRSGSEMIRVLDELQTYQIWYGGDLSGTIINASSPVAVFAGSFCQAVAFVNQTNPGFCSKLDEQLPPIDRLDKMYIVPPNYNREGTILKIVSPFENHLTYKIGSSETGKRLKPNGYFEIKFSDEEVVVIDSEKPVLVTSYATGSDITGDPYMVTIPGIRQYTDKYFVTVPGNFTENYIALMVEEKSLNNVVLNDTTIIQHFNDKKFYATVTIKDVSFVVLVLQISGGTLKVKSTDNSAFGLIVYGHRKNDGHGFVGKAVLPDTCVNSYQ